jgi:hypothetical protein
MKWLSEEHKPSWHENTYDYAEYSWQDEHKI